jgi:IS605 OrfB family transposase
LNAALAFEDLSDIRQSLNQKPRSKTERRRTNNWSFYQLRMFVGCKAAIAGIPLVFVPPAYTSQTCARCGHIHEVAGRELESRPPATVPEKGKSFRNGKKFRCLHCSFESDTDLNAAINISALGMSVIYPESPGMRCQLEGQLPLFPVSQICG